MMKIKHLDLEKFLQIMIDYVEYVIFTEQTMSQSFSIENKKAIRQGLKLIIDKCIQQEDIDIIEIYNKFLEEKKEING